MVLRGQGVGGKNFLDACRGGSRPRRGRRGTLLWREDLVIEWLQGVGGEGVRPRKGVLLVTGVESEATSQAEEEQALRKVRGLRMLGGEVTGEPARVRLAWDTAAQHSSWEGGPDGRAGMAQRGESSHLPSSRELASRWSRHRAPYTLR